MKQQGVTGALAFVAAVALVNGTAFGGDARDRQSAFGGTLARVPNASTQVAAAEVSLMRRGYPVGAVDGILDPTSYAGLLGFQRDHGLALTGRVDRATAAALEIGFDAGTAAAASPRTE